MIYGIGTDIVEVKRMDEAVARHGQRFVERILNAIEQQEMPETQALARGFSRFLAKRFAVKEAFAKALGTGIGEIVGLHDVWIVHADNGRPMLATSDALSAYLAKHQITRTHVSISDEQDYAVAFVILEN
jgi:holo-[acyl-carrier protein] synthase